MMHFRTAYPPGNYTCLETSFIIHRGLVYYLIQYYIPSVLLVVLSWLSFWISIDAVVARVSIGLLTVLSLSLQSTNSQFQLPRVSYIKAIDVWMSTCLIFVFSSLIEFAIVNVWSRKEESGQLAGGKKRDMEDKGVVEIEEGRAVGLMEGTEKIHHEDNRKNSGKVLTWGGVVTNDDCELNLMQVYTCMSLSSPFTHSLHHSLSINLFKSCMYFFMYSLFLFFFTSRYLSLAI